MTRYFCDGCGEELVPDRITNRDQQGRLFGRVAIPGEHTMFVQVIAGTDQTWNRGDFCNACIATALAAALGPRDRGRIGPVLSPPHSLGEIR